MTTKEQERKALEQIRKIFESLGEDSYVATAFEGCFEIAEENINNDFACSMKQRVDAAEKKAELLAKRAHEKGQEAKDLALKLAEAERENIGLNNKLAAAHDMMIWPELYKAIWGMAFDNAEAGKANILRAAGTMADLADHPTDIAFQAAVKVCKKNKQAVEDAEWIMAKLEDIKPAGC